MHADWIGWVATAVFVGSYLCTKPEALRRVQMVGAALWIGYGLLTQAAPVVTANALVLGAAALANARRAPQPRRDRARSGAAEAAPS